MSRFQKALPLGELARKRLRGRGRRPQRRAFAESGAVNAVFLYDPICEKAIQEIIKGNDVSDDLRIGIGIRNVVARIHIFYGDSAQISLWSKEGEGTKFEFLLPYPERKEECI